MKSGARRTRIIFEARRAQSDRAGNERAEWVFKFECWARRRMLVGGETVLDNRLAGVSTAVINVESARSTREIRTDWRARDKQTGQLYNINSITLDERGRDLDILVTTGAAV